MVLVVNPEAHQVLPKRRIQAGEAAGRLLKAEPRPGLSNKPKSRSAARNVRIHVERDPSNTASAAGDCRNSIRFRLVCGAAQRRVARAALGKLPGRVYSRSPSRLGGPRLRA